MAWVKPPRLQRSHPQLLRAGLGAEASARRFCVVPSAECLERCLCSSGTSRCAQVWDSLCPVTWSPQGFCCRCGQRRTVDKSSGLSGEPPALSEHGMGARTPALQLALVLPLRRGEREKNPFRLVFFRYLYTLECFSCSLANLYLSACFSDVLKIIWLLWLLFGAVAVQRVWKSGSSCLLWGL